MIQRHGATRALSCSYSKRERSRSVGDAKLVAGGDKRLGEAVWP